MVNPPITFRHIEVSNPNLFGKRVDQIFLKEIAPVTITRLLRRGATEPVLVGADTVLQEGDRLRVVGRIGDLEKVALFIGQPVEGEIAFERMLTKKSIVVSKRRFVGVTLGYFNFRETFNVQLARITRSGIDLVPDANTRLHLGDVLHAVGDERALRNISRMLGNDLKATYEISLLPILVGLLLGLSARPLTLPLPLVGPLTLGTTGGTLLAGLLLGARYQTGPLIWDVPAAGNRLIRDLGLALFMAAVGTSAGASFVATLQERGLALLFSGVLVTLLPVAVGAAPRPVAAARPLSAPARRPGRRHDQRLGTGRRRHPVPHHLRAGGLRHRLSGRPDRQDSRRQDSPAPSLGFSLSLPNSGICLSPPVVASGGLPVVVKGPRYGRWQVGRQGQPVLSWRP